MPRSVAFPTSPVSGDAVLLMTAHIVAEFAGGGLGRVLIQGVVKDLLKRGGFRAIEAFGDARWSQAGLRAPGRRAARGRFQDRAARTRAIPGCAWICARH